MNKRIKILILVAVLSFSAAFVVGCRNDAPPVTYTINYDLSYEIDGETLWSTVDGETSVAPKTISEGSTFLAKIPEPDERTDIYVFVGWYYISGDTSIRVTEATVFDPTVFTGIENNTITLRAVLSSEAVIVKFDLSYEIDGKTAWSTVNGETTVNDEKIADGFTFGSILPELDKRSLEDDYYFMGWYYVYSGGQTKIEENTVFHKADFIGLEGNTITLVAKLGKAWIGPY